MIHVTGIRDPAYYGTACDGCGRRATIRVTAIRASKDRSVSLRLCARCAGAVERNLDKRDRRTAMKRILRGDAE